MDDASSLISDLLAKLADLDDKVASYRKDMAAEFQRHSDALLGDLPQDLSDEVNHAIAAASLSGRYPSLYPGPDHSTPHSGSSVAGDEPPESPAIDRSRWDGRGPSPPPVLHHTSGTPPLSSSLSRAVNTRALGSSLGDASTRDPHAREREFQGLFTPTYLPLLESATPTPYSPPTEPTFPLPTLSVDPSSSDKDAQAAKEMLPASPNRSSTASPSGGLVPRFPPVRSFTDPSADCGSGGADSRNAKRRSALRRSSSSSNRTSPRRVRFDFEGEEVLPTSPPEDDPSPCEAAASSAPPSTATATVASPKPTPRDSLGPTASIFDDGDDYSPPPKKVSSSQALRALSKLPLENPGTWTVVNPSSDPAAPLLGGTRPASQPQAPAAAATTTTTNMMTTTARPRSPPKGEELEGQTAANPQLGSPLQDLEAYPDDASDESDDDFVSMPLRPARKMSNSPHSRSPLPTGRAGASPQHASSGPAGNDAKTMKAQQGRSDGAVNGKPAKAARKRGHAADGDDAADLGGDEFFEMEDDDESSATGTKRDTRPYLEHEDESELEDDAGRAGAAAGRTASVEAEVLSHSLTPSRPFASSGGGDDPLASPTSMPVSVGSYKGSHIAFDVVKDPLVHQKAAELGNLATFVGSVHDSADPTSSFRGGGSSLSGVGGSAFTGTPRSLVERLMLEEMVDQGGVPSRR